ncbi:MAG: hypothetical protein K0Q71_3220 [Thermomicrobiales bacterium]|nr:hypothetical protein [Thermomicrobiales bacterium]
MLSPRGPEARALWRRTPIQTREAEKCDKAFGKWLRLCCSWLLRPQSSSCRQGAVSRRTEKRLSDQTSPGAVAPSAARETLSAADRVAGNRTSWRQADVVRSWPLTRIQTRYCATISRPLPVALGTNAAASGRPGRGKQLLDHLRGEGVTVLSSTDCVDSSPAALTGQSVDSSTPGALPSKRPPSEQTQRRPLSMRPNADVPVAEWWMGSTGTTWSTSDGASVGEDPTLALTN